MRSPKETIRISKFLSLVLRHRPETLGIVLDQNGWTNVDTLLVRMQEKGFQINRNVLQEVVDSNNKQRFALSPDKQMIRASQGHSVQIDLGYTPQVPPPVLYHGTAEKNLTSILSEGLQKGTRHHVHLSTGMQTAKAVGSRHGKPVVLRADAGAMHKEGYTFYQSDNGVWLTDAVPPQFLEVMQP